MFRVTPVVRNLIIINVIIFILQKIFPIGLKECLEFHYYLGTSLSALLSLWPLGSCPFAPYQFFTYMFAHGGFWHIAFNMLTLASFAPILETYWGEKKFLIFYIATGIGAGIIYAFVEYAFFHGTGGGMLGASGAIYGVLAAFGLLFPELEITLMFPPLPIKAKYMIFITGFLTFIMDDSGNVAHAAHFGGAFIAFIIIRVIWRDRGSGSGY